MLILLVYMAQEKQGWVISTSCKVLLQVWVKALQEVYDYDILSQT